MEYLCKCCGTENLKRDAWKYLGKDIYNCRFCGFEIKIIPYIREVKIELKIPANSNGERACSCSAVKRIGVGKYCPDCGGRNSRR